MKNFLQLLLSIHPSPSCTEFALLKAEQQARRDRLECLLPEPWKDSPHKSDLPVLNLLGANLLNHFGSLKFSIALFLYQTNLLHKVELPREESAIALPLPTGINEDSK